MLFEESTVTPVPESIEEDPNCWVQLFVVVLSVEVVEEPLSLLLLHEMTARLKNKIRPYLIGFTFSSKIYEV